MTIGMDRIIVVTGATGLQGGAVARELLADGWRVRALTRRPTGEKAQAIAALGAEVVQGDMDQPPALAPVFAGAYGTFSVQNPMTSGAEGEIRQGKNVADAAARAGVQHFVYASAGTGERGTGIPSWETKLVIEDYLKERGLPLTILRPMAFMEIMTESKFYPAVGAWHLMPRLTGGAKEIYWLCAADLGKIAAKVFADPARFTGQDLRLASDAQSLDACRALYREVLGKDPPRFPMPLWLFRRFGFAGRDLPVMWRWLRGADLGGSTQTVTDLHPTALSVRAWLERQKAG